MKNKLGTTENLLLFNKKGKRVYDFSKNSKGYSSEYTYDENGKILTYKNSDGYSCEYTYDKNGKILTYKSSDGYSCEYTYDSNGKELTFKNSNGYSCEKTYDSNGKELTFKDSSGYSRGFDICGMGIHETITKGEQYYNETFKNK